MHCAGLAPRHIALPLTCHIPHHCKTFLSPTRRQQVRCQLVVAALEQRDYTATRGELFQDFKWGRIHYRHRPCAAGTQASAVLLVHGFGVGSFQFQKLQQLLQSNYSVYAVDLLGQGLSWPSLEVLRGTYCCCVGLRSAVRHTHLCTCSKLLHRFKVTL